jgi:hypothetical protein
MEYIAILAAVAWVITLIIVLNPAIQFWIIEKFTKD